MGNNSEWGWGWGGGLKSTAVSREWGLQSTLTSFMVVLFCSQRHSITLILLQGEEGRGWGEGKGGGEAEGPKHLHPRRPGRAVGSGVVLSAPAPLGIPSTRGRVAPAPGPLLRVGTLPPGPAPALPGSSASLTRPRQPPRLGQIKQLPLRPSARA